jgi:AraC family transcriptional regulator, transcriptional activator of pobA
MLDTHLLRELQVAFSRKAKNTVIDLDSVIIHRNSFSLLRIEDLYQKTKGIIPPFRQSDFFIVFVKQGSGKRSIGHFTFTTRNNSLVVIPQRVIHAATYTSQPYGYFISFSPDFFLQQAFSYKLLNSKKVLKPLLQPYVVLSEAQAAEISSVFEKIIEECHSGFEEKKQMIAIKILELLILCDRFFRANPPCDCMPGYSEVIKRFHELIEAHYIRHKDVQFYAAAMHTHPNNLNHIVKKVTGRTAKQTITDRLILEAKYLLVSTTRSVKEIAYDLGFEDPNYFISFFKKNQQRTPSRFREQPA